MGCIQSATEQDLVNQTKQDKDKFTDKYVLEEEIGRGSFSRVYAATDKENKGMAVAVKVIRALQSGKKDPVIEKKKNLANIEKRLAEGGMDDWEKECMEKAIVSLTKELDSQVRATNVDTIMQEINLMKSCTHVNIMAVHGVFTSDKCVCIILTRCYVDLSLVVDKARQPLQDEKYAVRFCKHLLRACSYLHDQKSIIHYDVKPANCSLDAPNIVKAQLVLADFGLSEYLPEGKDFFPEKSKKLRGTMIYLAPEAIRGDVGKSTDVWATGCVFYEMLSCQEFSTQYMVYTNKVQGKFCTVGSGDDYIDTYLKMVAREDSAYINGALSKEEFQQDGRKTPIRVPSDPVIQMLQSLFKGVDERPKAAVALKAEIFKDGGRYTLSGQAASKVLGSETVKVAAKGEDRL